MLIDDGAGTGLVQVRTGRGFRDPRPPVHAPHLARRGVKSAQRSVFSSSGGSKEESILDPMLRGRLIRDIFVVNVSN